MQEAVTDKQSILRSRVYVSLAHVGKWKAVRIETGSCKKHDLTLISTMAECKEAARQLLGTTRVMGWHDPSWQYCSVYEDHVNFDPRGMPEGKPAHLPKTNLGTDGVCKKGTVHTTAAPVLKPP